MYVFQLPFEQLKSLSSILDVGNDWEKIAGLMGFSSQEVYAFRQAAVRNESPTVEILRAWGSRGYKLEQLFELLMKIHHHRALQLLLPFVDKKYQELYEKRKQKQLLQTDNNDGQKDENNESIRFSQPPSDFIVVGASTSKAETDFRNHPPQPAPINSVSSAAPKTNPNSSYNNVSTGSFDVSIAAGLHSTLSIPYAELSEATDNFAQANILGRGGYGVVYKGTWKQTSVAVKQIGGQNRKAAAAANNSAEKERLKQSLMELKALTLYRHDNILPLYGYSLDGQDPCLVYQFMAGGSLEDRLLCRGSTNALEWNRRLSIVIGSSRGLNFLHTCAREPLIHGDIKSANILLDAHLEPKIGDFGLSRRGVIEIPGNTPPVIASHIKGTLAYLPPEFLRSKHQSTKLDVYSYGVVLFEIATGLRAYSDNRKPENLVDFIKGRVQEDKDQKSLAAFADCKPAPTDLEKTVPSFMTMALRCTAADPTARPAMNEVLVNFERLDL